MTEHSRDSEEQPYTLHCNVTEPCRKHSATVIFLHGLGGSGYGIQQFLGLPLKWKSSDDLGHIKFIFPTAPSMAVTGLNGENMPSWFDYYSFDVPNRAEDEKGLYNAVKWVNELISIEETQHHIPPERIIVGGLSQGGAVSLLTLITIKKSLAGLFALSTYVPLRKKTPEIVTSVAKEIPIFWGHGKKDRQVNHEFSFECAETLASHLEVPFLSYDNVAMARKELQEISPRGLRFHSYERLEHSINDQELEDLFVWILFLLPYTRDGTMLDEVGL